MKEKIISLRKAVILSRKFKKQGKKVVTYNGSFDLLHYGHIASIEEAKKQGDVLLILLNSDWSVKTYKGPSRPIIPMEMRAKMLASLYCVDYITIFKGLTPIAPL